MRNRRYSVAQRGALWRAYGKRCFYCSEPLSFDQLEIDHLLPKRIWNDHAAAGTLRALGQGPEFDLDGWTNLVPTHSRCNRRKHDYVFDASTIAFYLEITRKAEPTVLSMYQQIERQSGKDSLLVGVGSAVERGILSHSEVVEFLESLARPDPVSGVNSRFDPLVICVGINFFDEEMVAALPPDLPPTGPELYDWLELDVLQRVEAHAASQVSVVDDQCNGETMSIRMAVWNDDLEPVLAAIPAWWEVLEVRCFSDIYGATAEEFFAR